MKYIYHHLGLGDHIICNGLVRSLIKSTENYKMFVKPHNLVTVSFMYKDLKNLSFLVGDDSYSNNFIRNNNMCHDEFFEKKPFPSKRPLNVFVGQAFNENDKMLYPEHINHL
jgi:hypothetical protein